MPQPLPPMMATTLPRGMVSEMPSRTGAPPYENVTFSISTRFAATGGGGRQVRVEKVDNKGLNTKGKGRQEPSLAAEHAGAPAISSAPPISVHRYPPHVRSRCPCKQRHQALWQGRGVAPGRPRDRARRVPRPRGRERRRQDDADQVHARFLRRGRGEDRALRRPPHRAALARPAHVPARAVRAALLPHRPRFPLLHAATAARAL